MGAVTLVLFDIDGTLLRSRGSGRGAMAQAAGELFSRPDLFDGLSFAGAVDLQIVSRALAQGGLAPTGRRVGRLRRVYVRRLKRSLRHDQGEVCPGVHRAIEAVSERAKVGLLTGNWREGAQAKLAAFDLLDSFVGCVGSYGGDAMERDSLVPIAVRRAQRRWGMPRRVIVIGDTAADVRCARAGAAALPGVEVVAVAVATGFASSGALEAAEPDLLLKDLEEGLPALMGLL